MSYRWVRIGVVCSVLFFPLPLKASTYLDLGDPAYLLFSRLEAEGVIRSALLTTKPMSRTEAVRLLEEAGKNAEGRSDFIKSLVRELSQRIGPESSGSSGVKPVESLYGKYVNTNAAARSLTYKLAREKEQALNYNNDGILYGHGSNGQAGITSRADDLGRFSFYFNPEFTAAQGEGSELFFRKAYAVLDLGWDLIAGKNSQWWGPGYHGAILLSNNAEPFTMLQITNPVPSTLPWIFSYLGTYRFTYFVTQLEKDRADIAEPYFWGMRVVFKPHPNLEIGFERTALLGGRGRPTDVGTWLNSMFGTREHDREQNPGDQRAGYDLKLTLPFELQPLQVYWEEAGEENRQRNSRMPYKLADLYGFYLPRVLSYERISLRAEYATNHVSYWPDVWYTHGVYTAGYTYNGQIMGHHMGTDSRDLFAELTCRFPEKNARWSLAYDRSEHSLSGPVRETAHELSLNMHLNAAENADLALTYGYSWMKNVDFVPGVVLRSSAASGTITRRF
ncbi:MAG: hypothetical protein A2X58_11410 [Nitrospirae bacterium GWC2_56_14]|nr:MAG: hypothetical protein A2X58_11410 [Nitrospirae bacterium GWC2_56_14]